MNKLPTYIAGLCLLITLIFLFPKNILAGATPNFTMEFGKVETVYSWSTQKCGDADIPDFPPRALVDSSGNLQLYSSESTNRKFIGNNLTDIKHDCHVILSSNLNSNPRMYDDYEWLTSPYTLDGNIIYGLMHTEYHGYAHNNCDTTNPNYGYNCWWNSINLATSTNAGYTFTHATPPAQNVANASINYNPKNTSGVEGILGPSNIILKDGYYYTKVLVITPGTNLINSASTGGTCVMRTNNLADPSSWKFWDGTGFNTPTQGVPASGKCAQTFANDWDWHWDNYFGTYLSTGYVGLDANTGNNLEIETSSNLTTVDTPMFRFSYTPKRYTDYFTFLDPGAETRNFEDIGRSPWLYYVTCGDDVANCASFLNNDRDLKRVRVRFNKPGDVGKYDVIDLHFNEYKGTKTLDSSFYGNDGTLSGNVSLKQEGDTKFVDFASNPGIIVVNDSASLSLTGDITITTRIRTTQSPAAGIYPLIVEKQDDLTGKRNYGLYLTNGGKVHFNIGNGTQYFGSVSTKSINDGAWHDVQVNFSSSTGIATFVIDGKFDSQIKQGGNLADAVNHGTLKIARNEFVGDLDHMTIYNYLLPVPTSSSTPAPTSTPTSKPGDLNADGKIDINDYNLLMGNFGKVGTGIVGDIDGNGKVDIFDYNILVGNFGK